MVIHQNVSLKPFNTFKIEANVSYFMRIENLEDLEEAYDGHRFKGLPKLVIGSGSNILFTGNQRKAIIQMGFEGIEPIKEDQDYIWVEVGGGVIWHQLVMWAVSKNYGGLENLSLIPGTVGAAPMQNIGAYGVELKDIFTSLKAFDLEQKKLRIFSKSDCGFGYRTSVFKTTLKDRFVIVSVVFKLSKKPQLNISYGIIEQTLASMEVGEPTVRNVSEAVIQIRQSKLPDPAILGNAGSFFKNPVVELLHFEALETVFTDIPSFKVTENEVKIPAAWLIENCGFKGKRIGNVGVHDKQALVLVNYGGGTGAEILDLSEKIQHSVQKKFGIALDREVNII